MNEKSHDYLQRSLSWMKSHMIIYKDHYHEWKVAWLSTKIIIMNEKSLDYLQRSLSWMKSHMIIFKDHYHEWKVTWLSSKIIIMNEKSHDYLQYISKQLVNLLVINCMGNWLHKAPTIFAHLFFIINRLCSHISGRISHICAYSWNCLLIFSRVGLRVTSTFWGNNWSLKYNISLIVSILTSSFLDDTNNTTNKQYNEDK
jgi:hypothetical protein